MPNQNDLPSANKKSGSIARAAMWLGGSALFGSLALVLLNRRALRSMHEAPEVEELLALTSDDDIY